MSSAKHPARHTRSARARDQLDNNNTNLQSLHSYLVQFDHKRRSTREKALNALVNALISSPRHNFVEENHITLSHTCLARLTSKKKGSGNFSKAEIILSVRAISLLVLNLVDEDYAHEVFDECLPVLCDALVRFDSEIDLLLEVLGCLGMVGFFGSSNSMETEKVMLLVWDNIIQSNDLQPSVLAAAINSWSFLLSGVHRQNLSGKNWKKSISYFSKLLKRQDFDSNNDDDHGSSGDDDVVVLAARNALGMIFSIDLIEKFSEEFKLGEDCSLSKDEILGKIKEDLDGVKYYGRECGNLSQIIQVKFLKKLLGKVGFSSHMEKNEIFHELFHSLSYIKAKKAAAADVVDYAPEREEVVLKFFQREVEIGKDDKDDLLVYVTEKEKKVQNRMKKSSSSCLSKARTQLLNKQRKAANQFSIESEFFG